MYRVVGAAVVPREQRTKWKKLRDDSCLKLTGGHPTVTSETTSRSKCPIWGEFFPNIRNNSKMRALTPKLVSIRVVQLTETRRTEWPLKVTLPSFWRQQDIVMRFNLHRRGTKSGCPSIESFEKSLLSRRVKGLEEVHPVRYVHLVASLVARRSREGTGWAVQ